MFLCHKCGGEGFLIRGLCSKCAPGLHGNFNKQMEAYRRDAEAFENKFGIEPLADWTKFEEFIDERNN